MGNVGHDITLHLLLIFNVAEKGCCLQSDSVWEKEEAHDFGGEIRKPG